MMSTKKVTPSVNSSGARAVYDGATRVGTIIVRDDSFFAFDAIGIPVGEFATQREAVLAIPSVVP
jgi:hypothetical protein